MMMKLYLRNKLVLSRHVIAFQSGECKAKTFGELHTLETLNYMPID